VCLECSAMNANIPSDLAGPASDPFSDFAPTEQLNRSVSPEALALIAGDLGDASYRIDNFAESLDWVRRISQNGTAVTLVALKERPGDPPEVLLQCSSRLKAVSEDQQTMELDLPLATPPLGKGLTVRGSARLQGVIVTFECESLGTVQDDDGKSSVLRARLPFRLYRLQRRDSFRVPVPSSQGVFITLKPGFRHLENLKALDLSCGGASVLVRAPLEAVHMGKRFAAAIVKLGPHATHDVFKVDMLIRHVRLAPPGLSQLLGPLPSPPRPAMAPTMRTGLGGAARPAGGPPSRDAALAAVGALLQPELLQLGIEFERMPTQLERNLARLVNELGVNLVTRVRDES
jgi:c-di-GMP-binding flagellar brake protein YcgR